MNDYDRVEKALKAGADPEMLCATCPWDRFCVTPPEMTAEDVERTMREAEQKDEERRREAIAKGDKDPFPIGMLMTAVAFGGKQYQAKCCPVFALRLRTNEGHGIVMDLKAKMQERT